MLRERMGDFLSGLRDSVVVGILGWIIPGLALKLLGKHGGSMEQNVQIVEGVKGHFELKAGVIVVSVEFGLGFLIQKLDDAVPNPVISQILQVLKALAEKA